MRFLFDLSTTAIVVAANAAMISPTIATVPPVKLKYKTHDGEEKINLVNDVTLFIWRTTPSQFCSLFLLTCAEK